MKISPIILCGGSGTRLWPLSRKLYPKQFLMIAGSHSLFQQTLLRLSQIDDKNIQIDKFFIITNESHRFLVLEQIGLINLKKPFEIILEPESRNTAPALTLAALAASDTGQDSKLIVCPADHFIKNANNFVITSRKAIQAVKENTIVVMGIKPSRPETGFGYIKFEGNKFVKNVINFKEKPKLSDAKKMLIDRSYLWNAGIFILDSKTWINAIKISSKTTYSTVLSSWKSKTRDEWFTRPDIQYFSKSKSNSIDYAVMERFKSLGLNVKLVSLKAGWSDIGSFISLKDIHKPNKEGNILKGDVITLNSKNSIAISTKKHLSLLGVSDLIIVETSDSVLVANKNDAQSIKELVKLIEKNNSNLLEEQSIVHRPWGWYEVIDEGINFIVKRICVKPLAKLSYQSHSFRNEHWVVVKGIATIIKDEKKITLKSDESTYIQKKVKHQLMNYENDDLEIIEVQTGSKISESDIKRYKDSYGRK
jgi:mannose-1-phosphate guanylyltransferase/mannose-6-phosphate isomerase